jgi:GYF domain 2
MRREERTGEGWYYRQDGEAFGPISTEKLKELLVAGRLRPRQAVWMMGNHSLFFIHAETAASGTPSEGSKPASA